MFPTKSLLYSYQNGLYWAIPLWSLVCLIFVCFPIFVGHLDDWSLVFIMHLGKILRGFAWWEGGGSFKFFSWWLPLVPAWILRGFTSRLHLPSTFYKDRYSSNSATFRVPGFSAPLFPFINFSHFHFHALMDLSASPFSICFHIFPIYTSVPSWIFKNFRLSPTSCFFATSHLVSTSSPPSIV